MAKKSLKALSTAALAAAFTTSAIVPAAVASAETPAEATLEISHYVVEIDGKAVQISAADFVEMKAAGKIEGSAVKFVKANDVVYTLADFTAAKASLAGSNPTQEDVLKVLADTEGAAQDVELYEAAIGEDGTISAGDKVAAPAEELLKAAEEAVAALPTVEEVKVEDKAAVEAAVAKVAAAKEAGADVTELQAKVDALVEKIAKLEAAPSVESVKAVNAKTIEVTFNKEFDSSKAKFEVKKGSAVVNVAKATVSADNKSVQLELASKLFEGEYTVNVTGLTEEKLSGSVKVENEKVAKIELLSENAPKTAASTATAGYRVLNQYGEDITKSPLAVNIDWNAPTGFTAADNNDGVLTITKGSELKVGDKVVVTGINATTNTVVTGTVTVTNEAVTDTVAFKEIYHADGKELVGNSTVSDYKLLIEAKDQYGNVVKATDVNEDILFTSSNESLIKVTTASDNQGKDKNQVGLTLQFGDNAVNGGKAIITAISKSTGKVSQYEVGVKAAPKLETFSMTAPAEVVAAGDTVKIPFTAADQYGKAITKAKDLTGVVEFSGTYGANKPEIKADANGDAYLEYKPDAKGTKIIIASFNGKVSQLNLNVVEAAAPVTIEPLKDVTTSVAKDGEVTIGLKNIVVKDEYGRTVDLKGKLAGTAAEGKYQIVAQDGNGGAVSVAGKIDADDAKITITGLAKGSEDVTFTLQESKKQDDNSYAFKDVATSPLKVAFSTVEKAAFESYELGTVDVLYADGAETTHQRDLKVYGVKADGSKVQLPSNYYTVITDTNAVNHAAGKLNAKYDATDNDIFKDKNEVTSKVTVVVDGAETPVTLTQDVKISKVTPKADKIEFTDAVKNGAATVATTALGTDDDSAALKAVLKVTDQYGVAVSSPTPKITVTNLKDNTDPTTNLTVAKNGTDTVDIQNAGADDTFTATYILDGQTVTVKFKVVTP
ncbi:hypothetical protein [Bacillus sp. FJAT-42315]|uniref:hypothetical protein n=1 Tax=Bacillus sp. FJAT-42315 TaxID=2014077 RepID=UPI000C248CE0|nr:hypothetical protein [Bacillus sp. FJAT-42315]